MNKQYKLYIIDKIDMQETLNQLYKLFDKKSIIDLGENKIAIEYDYHKKDYKSLIECMSQLPTTQNIVTSSKFLKVLKACIKQEILIDEIKLLDIFEEDNSNILKCINNINYNQLERSKYIQKLLDELTWLNYSEGIDIKYMSFRIKSKNKPILIKFSLYDTGIVTIDADDVTDDVFNIIKLV